MKNIAAILLALSILLCCWGCRQEPEQSYGFCYLQGQRASDSQPASTVLAVEYRETASDNPGISYLLRLYLEGPVTEGLESPFPAGTALLSARRYADAITIHLSEQFSALKDIHLTLAAACLSETCFRLCNTEEITIISGEETYTYLRSSFTLTDASAQEP